jgi:opacity protein-like surface antigen
MNLWWGDWSYAVKRFGPYAWTTIDLRHGFGINIDGHSMILGTGGNANNHYKYFAGEGGVIYTVRRWNTIRPFVKAEAGYASLSFPNLGLPYTHQNEHIWGFGGGVEYHLYRHLWTRMEYEYDFFPHFYSISSGQFKNLNPKGFAAGVSYHFHR